MFRWFLITHNPKAAQHIIHRVRGIGAEAFSPTKLKVTKRADCNSVRTSETQLFPGYIFVGIDPEVVHTSAILQVSGVNGFVSFGGVIATVSESLIEALKSALLVRPDQKIAHIEHRNVHPTMLVKLETIMLMKSVSDRQSALFELLQAEKKILLHNDPFSRIASVIERPFVNDLIS